MKKIIVVQIFAFFLLASCQFGSLRVINHEKPNQFGSLKIINHEKPNIQTDFSPFKNMGCNESHGQENWYPCEEGSPLLHLGCNFIEDMPLLGGLTQDYPIVACILRLH